MEQLDPVQVLQLSGLKRTPGRIAVLEILQSSDYPLTPQEICQLLDDQLQVSFNGVSVYRTLDAFEEKGLVHKIQVGERAWRFALNREVVGKSDSHQHPHFICNQCGLTECLEVIKLSLPEQLFPEYRVLHWELYLKGICPGCMSIKNSNNFNKQTFNK